MKNNERIIMGIDISLAETGLAIYQERNNQLSYETIKITNKIKKDNELDDSLKHIVFVANKIIMYINHYQPDLIVIEDTFTNPRNMQTAKKLIQLGGIVRYKCHMSDLKFIDIAPTSLKKFLTGSGKAEKEMMINKVNEITGLEINNNNEADAIACCLYGLQHFGIIFEKNKGIKKDIL